MPRRQKTLSRIKHADTVYNNKNIAEFINKLMKHGKKSLAERITYDAFHIIEARQNTSGAAIFEEALAKAKPGIEVRPRRVGGTTYQVPVEVGPERGRALAMRWLIESSHKRTGKSMSEKLAAELLDIINGQGSTLKKKEDTFRMAEANKAFAHYRW